MVNPPRKPGSLSQVTIWSTAEPNLGIVSACMPTMKPLLLRLVRQGNCRDNLKSGKKSGSRCSPRRCRPPPTALDPSGLNKIKIGRAHQQFRELNNDTIEQRSDGAQTAQQTYFTDGEAQRDKLAVSLNNIEVQTNLDWQLESS